MLNLARVVDIHPESNAVDIVFMDDGRRYAGVQVVSGSAGTNFGYADLSLPDKTGYDAGNTNTRDIYAVVSFVKQIPVVLGFLFPQVAQCLFEDKERMVYRHASDVYVTVDKNGNTEVAHPSGTFLRIGETPGHEDLTGKDFDKVWKIERNTGRAVYVHLTVANAGSPVATLDIDPSGNVVETNAGNLSATVGGATTVDSAGAVTIKSGASITLQAPSLVFNGPVTQSGGPSTAAGPLTVAGNVSGAGISLKDHVHDDADGGDTGPAK